MSAEQTPPTPRSYQPRGVLPMDRAATGEMVERVGRAIEAEKARWGQYLTTQDCQGFLNIKRRNDDGKLVPMITPATDHDKAQIEWQRLLNEALGRAAIEAMREPTDAMVDAAWAATSTEVATREIWHEMITEALK